MVLLNNVGIVLPLPWLPIGRQRFNMESWNDIVERLVELKVHEIIFHCVNDVGV